MSEDHRRTLGRRGEELAARHLQEHGFAVVERNARTPRGEIDLILFDGSTLVFAEVKTRRLVAGQRAPRPDQAPLAGLGARQRARLRCLAAAWLAQQRCSRPFAETIRFDAIGIVLDAAGTVRRIDHLENAW